MTPLDTPPHLWAPYPDETAPRGGTIRATRGFRPHGHDNSHYPAKSERAERAIRENLTLHNHRMGHNIDENALPLDKLFR
jgi:hypothetical protein